MEEKLTSLILSATKLPGYKKHPFDTYVRLQIEHGITNVKHPRDVFDIDTDMLRLTAQSIVRDHQRWFAATGFATGLAGGPTVLTVGAAVDIEEYLRRIFLLSQEIGHIYGLIPNPFFENIDSDINVHFEMVKEEILRAMLIGLGSGGVTMGVAEVAKMLAEKEAKSVMKQKINEKIITQLSKNIAKVLGRKVTKDQISKGVAKWIPFIGGGINAYGNYKAIEYIGKNLIDNFEEEHRSIKSQVKSI